MPYNSFWTVGRLLEEIASIQNTQIQQNKTDKILQYGCLLKLRALPFEIEIMRRLTWNVPQCRNITQLLTAVLKQGLLCFGNHVPENVVDNFVTYITQKDIVADLAG